MIGSLSFIRRLTVAAGLAIGVIAVGLLGAGPVPIRAAAAADGPLPSLGPVQVRAFGTEAVVTFTTAEPAVISVSHTAVTTTPTPSASPSHVPGLVDTPTSGTLAPTDTPPPSAYVIDHEIHLKSLASNTTYDLSLRATTQAGDQASRELRFTTQKQRIRITLDTIQIDDDGDLFGVGEPLWLAAVDWAGGTFNGCYPNDGTYCRNGEWGEGIIAPRTRAGSALSFVFAEENFDSFPKGFFLRALAEEDDYIPGGLFDCVVSSFQFEGCPFEGRGGPYWEVPQGVEFASTSISISANDIGAGGFRSTLTFRFEVFHNNTDYSVVRRNIPLTTWWD